MDLDEGQQEFQEMLQEAESKGFWVDEGGYRVNTLSTNIANDAREMENKRIELGLGDLTERARQFDETRTAEDNEFLVESQLSRDQFDEASAQFTLSIEARADEFASNLGLERDSFLQSVREFRAGTLGVVEGARDISAQGLDIDITYLNQLRSTDPGATDLPELEARILEDIKLALPGATEEQVLQVSRGETVTVDSMVTLQGRQMSESIRQFDREMLLRRTEDRTRVLDITTRESMEELRLGLEDRKFEQSKKTFEREMNRRVTEFTQTHGLNSAQAKAIQMDLSGRLQLSQDQLEQEILEFAARNQLDLAELTGQTAIGGVITAEELGVPTGIVMRADGRGHDLEVMQPRISALQDSFSAATGQELSAQEALDLLGGGSIEVEGLPTLAARSLAATITSQQMSLAADISRVADEHELNVSAFSQSMLESDRAFDEAVLQAAIDNGLEEDKFNQAITAWRAQDVNSKAALRMNLSNITGLMTGEGEITPEELGVTQEGIYEPVLSEITMKSLGFSITRGLPSIFADARREAGITSTSTPLEVQYAHNQAYNTIKEAVKQQHNIIINTRQAQLLAGGEFGNPPMKSIEGPPIPGQEGEINEEVFAEKTRQYQEAFFLATGQELSFELAQDTLAPSFDKRALIDQDVPGVYRSSPSIGIGVTELPTMAARQIAGAFGLQLDQFNTAKDQFDANFEQQVNQIARSFEMDEENHELAYASVQLSNLTKERLTNDLMDQYGDTLDRNEAGVLINLLNGGSMGWAPEKSGGIWQALSTVGLGIAGSFIGPAGAAAGTAVAEKLF